MRPARGGGSGPSAPVPCPVPPWWRQLTPCGRPALSWAVMRIVVALSGGVDSAVAAARLQREGADVVGVHYRTGATAGDAGAPAAKRSCCGVDDARDARAVAARLAIPFYVVDVSEAFGAKVIDAFVKAHAAGTTPNPCIACNQDV